MSSLPAYPLVLSREQMREADRVAGERFGVPSLLLMENAGRGLAELVLRRAASQRRATDNVVVVCGPGANGGDGFVAARHLAQRGVAVRVFLCAPRSRVEGDAAVALGALERMRDVSIEDGSGWTDEMTWHTSFEGASIIVDAIFGIGLRDDVDGVPWAAITAMNESPAFKIAADIPSGLDADTGRVHGVAFAADLTATMGARKLGLVVDAEANAYVGEVEVVDLGVPLDAPVDAGPLCHWIDGAAVRAELPVKGATSHKGTSGHLLVIAGSAGKTGAALLAGRAALRGGVGLVTLASTAAGQTALDSKVIEIMTARYTETEDADPRTSASTLAGLAVRMGAVAIGPGIPTGANMRGVVRELASRLAVPMVIDADALNLIGTDIVRVLSISQAPRVLTPHPGEMSRLMGRPVEEIQANRLGAARTVAEKTNAVVVLKGARTLVVAPDGTTYVNPTALGALGTAGSGDVLTGLLGALLARGMEPFAAARAAVYLHGAAGEAVADRLGAGLVAGDLPDAIATVIRGR
ncbi:MAG TPA: NAD(P)H-hydrate dehydratase [Polyangia bacterium]|nr:NAD(P)H-hydrate dehydratase [Polyangia bacterium]